jgi:choline-sulfatase/uncharacterized sulfatase
VSTQPNILFILSDQHNAKVLGHVGHPDVQTPNLDRMAAEGVRFENAITQNPICTPSRVSYLSGQYCHNHGYYALNGRNPGGLPNIFGHFRRAGYATAALGKIHCPEYWVEDECDVFHETCNCSVGGRSRAYTQFLKERNKLHLEDHGAMPEFGDRGRQNMEGRPSPLSFEEAQEGWIAHQAIEAIKKAAAAGKPFLVHTSLPRPHQCTAPSPPFWELYEGKELALPLNADYEMVHKAPHFRASAERWRRGDWTLFEPRTFEAGRLRKLHGYLGAISQVDHAVGLMLDYLSQAGLAENTIVVYSADHGDYACEHGIMEKAPGICSDAITRVPHIWWSPGRFKAGHVAPEIVEAVDLPNTLCTLAGLELMETSDGKDITHLLRGERGEVHRVGVTEFAWSKSLRKGQYRYVHYPPQMFADEYPDGFAELYDLEADPWEMRNLYFEASYRDLVHEMQNEMLNWLISTTRPGTVLEISNHGSFESSQTVVRYNYQINADGKIHPDRLLEARTKNYL